MKIIYSVAIEDGFHIENRWYVSNNPLQTINVKIEFEPHSGNNMNDANSALGEYMKTNYPDYDYKIYYWEWI